ncbi:aldo/keto reductase [Clostridium felsineum]|uniref:1-deoxyxylulose-5-phosphate synthase YajO n=1 Tax=Clostridium felsineum TaxID=36839 RepID=A0A1S8L4B6_9CLOT|nr:aldo/keto reductase [Clostridium felsineum]URZ06859.1 1-deoxyxylulose-5-phosphate synthase YajO [Clostridium felsineum]URZ11891.1 1-deoxyxylulose-5-phosphate synthase YajO [Clostridium felsineum]
MEYTKLGKTDLNVSRLCLGTMGFGASDIGQHTWTLDEGKSKEIIKRALDLGINFIDTAIGYSNGTSEQYIGRAIKEYVKREDIVLATKFFLRTQDEISNNVSVKEHINKLLNESLQNLATDYIDLYIYHFWDYKTPIEEIMEALNEAVKAGKIRHIGISNCFAWQIAKANYISRLNGWAEFVSIQGHYNLLFREEEREMIPYCSEENIAITPYSPLASGRLVKTPTEVSKRLVEDTYAKGKYDSTAEKDSIIIDRVAKLAEKKGLTRIQIALGWLLTKVTAPVVGATKISHIEEAVKAVPVKLNEEEIAYLEEAYVPHKLVGLMSNNN